MLPFVVSPSSVFNKPDIDFNVVDFPAPFAHKRDTISPSFTSRLNPLMTKTTSLYTTSIFLIFNMNQN